MSKNETTEGYFRIKIGAKVFQDFVTCIWPQCKPPRSEYENEDYKHITKYPYAIFKGTYKDGWWDLTRLGYGKMKSSISAYGNGSISVRNRSDLIKVNINKTP